MPARGLGERGRGAVSPIGIARVGYRREQEFQQHVNLFGLLWVYGFNGQEVMTRRTAALAVAGASGGLSPSNAAPRRVPPSVARCRGDHPGRYDGTPCSKGCCPRGSALDAGSAKRE
jgi:hypothetical protein